ncbi:MAG: O-antigen ligase family protein [Planctomycetaceae bacterium]|nr:O-antigen ligase family protein [Planctomycetaceae bacterium]
MALHQIAQFVRLLGQSLIVIAVLISPWLLGSESHLVQWWLFLPVMASLACGILALLMDGKSCFPFPGVMIPLLLLLLLIGLQLKPLSPETLKRWSPKTAELRQKLLPQPGSAELRFIQKHEPDAMSGDSPAPASIYPSATRHLLARFLLACGAFVAAQMLFKNRFAVYLLLGAVSVNGALLAFFGIVRRFRHAENFLLDSLGHGAFSTFENHNNAAGYLGMCFGAVMTMVLYSFFLSNQKNESAVRWDKRYDDAYLTPAQRFWNKFTGSLSPRTLFWGVIAALIISGILISLSRGGSIALAAALLFGVIAVLSIKRTGLSAIVFSAVLVFGVGLIFWAGLDEKVQHRLESIFDENSDGMRTVNWLDAMKTAGDFQWKGTGFGTYPYANLLHDGFVANNRIFLHAENQYLEIFVETGIFGFLFFIACILWGLFRSVRLTRSKNDDWFPALGVGLLMVLIFQCVASLFDFGTYITSNALLLAVLCGVLFAGISKKQDAGTSSSSNVFGFSNIQGIGMVIAGFLFLGLLVWGQKEIGKIVNIETAKKQLPAWDNIREIDPQSLAAAIHQLEEALQQRPGQAETVRELAEARIHLYHLLLYHEILATAGEVSDKQKEDFWQATSLENIRKNLRTYQKIGFQVPVDRICGHPAVAETLVPAFRDLIRSRQANPMSVMTHLHLARILPLLDPRNELDGFAQQSIQRAVMVSPFSSYAWYVAGTIENSVGNNEAARSYWKQTLTLSNVYREPILKAVMPFLTPENAAVLARETFPDAPQFYLSLLNQSISLEIKPEIKSVLLEEFRDVIGKDITITEGQKRYFLGRYAIFKEDYFSAIEQLTQACREEPLQADWHYWLAVAYHKNKQFDQAKDAIKHAMFLNPKNPGYQNYLKRIQNDALRSIPK